MSTPVQPVRSQARLHTTSPLSHSAPNHPSGFNIHDVDVPSALTWKDQVTEYNVRIIDGQVHSNPPSHQVKRTNMFISAKADSIRIPSSSKTASTEHLRERQYHFLRPFTKSPHTSHTGEGDYEAQRYDSRTCVSVGDR